jgi:hypothetical protein
MMRVRIMGKQTVSDAVPHSDLEQVGFQVGALTFTLMGKAGLREALAFRVFVPDFAHGRCHFIEDTICRLLAMLGQTSGEEHDFYEWVTQMLRFYFIFPEMDAHRTRRFNLKTCDQSETLREIAKLTQAKRLATPERLIKFVGETTLPTSRLLLDAIYIRPDLSIPLAHPDYIAFRAQCLSEMIWSLEQIEGIKRNTIEQLRCEIEQLRCEIEQLRCEIASDPKLSADQ